jgi:hypothetical protein
MGIRKTGCQTLPATMLEKRNRRRDNHISHSPEMRMLALGGGKQTDRTDFWKQRTIMPSSTYSDTSARAKGKTENLEAFANIVPAGYVYHEKTIVPRDAFDHVASKLKWYDIFFPDQPISPEQGREAREFLTAEMETKRLSLDSELGFVCLHHCRKVLLLLVMTWRLTNEIWESVYVKQLDADGGYQPIDFPTAHRGTYCVWELGAVWHERNAWVRFLKSTRDDEAKRTYLGDCFSGSV